ncbi:MAG: metal ABC transporter ATP-binding protein [Pseudomonadota bacterium]
MTFLRAVAPIQLVTADGKAAKAPDSAAIALDVQGLTVSYGQTPAVFSIDANVPVGSMTAIIGPNGAGKSTLLKAVLGIIPRLSGTTQVFGQPVAQARNKIAYVPQRASVDWDFPTRVIDVVMMGLYRDVGLLNFIGREHRKRALDCLRRVGMVDFATRQVVQLSGGQQQRVFLARALAQDAELYLLDEPFAGVDAATEKAIVDVLKALKASGKTVVCVHHDLTTVTGYFDHVLMINVRKIAEGPVETAFTAESLQATYGGRLATVQIDQLRLPVA